MKHYELTYLISPDLSDEEANSLSTEISSLIQEKQGILEKNLFLLKKQLSYTIKKKTAAYLVTLNFEINSEKLEELKKQIESNSKILRYLIIVKKLSKKTIKTLIKKPKRTIKPKVELKEIEKKLEEILNEPE